MTRYFWRHIGSLKYHDNSQLASFRKRSSQVEPHSALDHARRNVAVRPSNFFRGIQLKFHKYSSLASFWPKTIGSQAAQLSALAGARRRVLARMAYAVRRLLSKIFQRPSLPLLRQQFATRIQRRPRPHGAIAGTQYTDTESTPELILHS